MDSGNVSLRQVFRDGSQQQYFIRVYLLMKISGCIFMPDTTPRRTTRQHRIRQRDDTIAPLIPVVPRRRQALPAPQRSSPESPCFEPNVSLTNRLTRMG